MLSSYITVCFWHLSHTQACYIALSLHRVITSHPELYARARDPRDLTDTSTSGSLTSELSELEEELTEQETSSKSSPMSHEHQTSISGHSDFENIESTEQDTSSKSSCRSIERQTSTSGQSDFENIEMSPGSSSTVSQDSDVRKRSIQSEEYEHIILPEELLENQSSISEEYDNIELTHQNGTIPGDKTGLDQVDNTKDSTDKDSGPDLINLDENFNLEHTNVVQPLSDNTGSIQSEALDTPGSQSTGSDITGSDITKENTG